MAFTDFTDCFPKTKLPIDFGELSYREFQTKAMLLPDALMAEWIAVKDLAKQLLPQPYV